MIQIRDAVLANYRPLYNNYSNGIGTSLDARGLVAQYVAVWDASAGGSYCVRQSEVPLANEVISYLDGSNNIYNRAVREYGNNFAAKLVPIRNAYPILQRAAASASNDVRPTIQAYEALWANNFVFYLFQGMSAYLDGLFNDYNALLTGSNTLFDQGSALVQSHFEAAFKLYTDAYNQLQAAYKTWDEVDGYDGYATFISLIPHFQNKSDVLSGFVVLKSPVNDRIFDQIVAFFDKIKSRFNSFPNFVQCYASTGIILDPGTPSKKFYARQLVLNIVAAVGARFYDTIFPGSSLYVTGLSYQHGGKMPPHAEHKTGKDCDLFSVAFRLGTGTYDQTRAVNTIAHLLSLGVTRVIFSDDAVVAAANAAYPSNPVAVNKPGHTTHIHFDVESATKGNRKLTAFRRTTEDYDQRLLSFGMPQSKQVEPVKRGKDEAFWMCDPAFINILKIDGRDIPAAHVAFYTALEISWQPSKDEVLISTPCPTDKSGGFFKQFKLYALIFGLGSKAIGCRSQFAIDATGGSAWVAVNDTDYGDNTGHILVKVAWR
jgi:hypothetical protein